MERIIKSSQGYENELKGTLVHLFSQSTVRKVLEHRPDWMPTHIIWNCTIHRIEFAGSEEECQSRMLENR